MLTIATAIAWTWSLRWNLGASNDCSPLSNGAPGLDNHPYGIAAYLHQVQHHWIGALTQASNPTVRQCPQVPQGLPPRELLVVGGSITATAAPFDGIAEAWLDDMASVQAMLGSDQWASVVQEDDKEFLEISKTLVMFTEETIEYRR